MLSNQQENKYIQMIPEETFGEDRRASYAVISGYRDGKTEAQIASYYSLDINLVNKWYSFFNFKNKPTSPGRGRKNGKKNVLNSFVKDNVGKTVTPKDIARDLQISLPTFYNFYNENRHFFKKVKRGEFQIVDPSSNRVDE